MRERECNTSERSGSNTYFISTTIPCASHLAVARSHSYTQYLVQVSDDRKPDVHWMVYRRYSEFRELYHSLMKYGRTGLLCPTCMHVMDSKFIKKFPKKRVFSSAKLTVIEKRRYHFHEFLEHLTKYARTCKKLASRGTCQIRTLADDFLWTHTIQRTSLNGRREECKSNICKSDADSLPVSLRQSSLSSVSRSSLTSLLDYPSTFGDGVKLARLNGEYDASVQQVRITPLGRYHSEKIISIASLGKKKVLQDQARKENARDSSPTLASSEKPKLEVAHTEAAISSNVARHSFSDSNDEKKCSKQVTSVERHSDPGVYGQLSLLNYAPLQREPRSCIDGTPARRGSRQLHRSSAEKLSQRIEAREGRLHSSAQERRYASAKSFTPMPTIVEEV